MQKADLTTRAVAGFVDLLLVIGLARLPDYIGFLSASGYILIRDGLFQGRSVAKTLIGIVVVTADEEGRTATYRESIIRNVPLALAYLLFLIPYAGWVLGPLTLGVECLVAIGDDRGMRVGDMLARTCVVQRATAPKKETRQEPQQQPGLQSESNEKQDAAEPSA